MPDRPAPVEIHSWRTGHPHVILIPVRLTGVMEPSSRAHRPTDHTAPIDQAARLAALAARPVRPPSFPPSAAGAASTPEEPRRTTRRRHAARGARATALGLSLASTGALAALFAFTEPGASGGGNQVAAASVVTATTASSAGTVPAASQPATTVPATTVSPATVPATTTPAVATSIPAAPETTDAPTATGATTVVDGAAFQNKWGNVQVEVTFAADGSIIDVTTLQTPYVDDKSVRINQRAVPALNSEALTAQSAQVDSVSGATYTSNDYRRSLQSAIDAANAAGITTIA